MTNQDRKQEKQGKGLYCCLFPVFVPSAASVLMPQEWEKLVPSFPGSRSPLMTAGGTGCAAHLTWSTLQADYGAQVIWFVLKSHFLTPGVK